jgi:hypothetical protein
VIRAGADVLRINGAHESPTEWATIAATFKACATTEGKQGRIFVDLPGPKLRTEIRTLEDFVIHLPRRKDHQGRSVAPTEVLLAGHYRSGPELPVPPGGSLSSKPAIRLRSPMRVVDGASSQYEADRATSCAPIAIARFTCAPAWRSNGGVALR